MAAGSFSRKPGQPLVGSVYPDSIHFSADYFDAAGVGRNSRLAVGVELDYFDHYGRWGYVCGQPPAPYRYAALWQAGDAAGVGGTVEGLIS